MAEMQPTGILTPKQVVQTFENVFYETVYVKPSEIGLDKNTYTDIGMDSLDTLDTIIILEKKFGIEISNNDGTALMGCTLNTFINIFTDSLVATKRLAPADAIIVKSQYINLLKPNKTKKAPDYLMDSYKMAKIVAQKVAKQTIQNQK